MKRNLSDTLQIKPFLNLRSRVTISYLEILYIAYQISLNITLSEWIGSTSMDNNSLNVNCHRTYASMRLHVTNAIQYTLM